MRLRNPFYIYSLYIDTTSYLADTILNDICLELDILEEKRVSVRNGKSYVVVFVRYHRKYDKRFRRFMDILRYNMWLYNNDSYLEDCREIFNENAEMFGGAWS